MIETETVMPRVAKSQTRTFSTAATSAFERKDGPTMEAIYRENKAGAEGLVAGKIPRPGPKSPIYTHPQNRRQIINAKH
jgi:hypothetical protein